MLGSQLPAPSSPPQSRGIQRSRTQFVTLKRGQNIKYVPSAFTEHGAIMGANVLNSPRAVQMSGASILENACVAWRQA